MYQIKEIYYTLQGEGARTGRASVFCRFSGCNLWSGREEDRASAKCSFCDTDFVGVNGPQGGRFSSAKKLAEVITKTWPERKCNAVPYVVFTGGEPLLQLDEKLLLEVKKRGFEIAVETNGTVKAPDGIDWLTVSPKPNAELVQKSGNELKLVYPTEVSPESVSKLSFPEFYLSPLVDESDPKATLQHTRETIDYCQSHPQWKLSIQTHKVLGIR